MSIRLSENHEVNPTISMCFWCGGQKNELILLGKLKGDAETPKSCIFSYEPCDKCLEQQKQGITLIGVSSQPIKPGFPEIQKDLYPTGKWAVLKKEAISNIFSEEYAKPAIEKGKMLVDDEIIMNIVESAKRRDN